MDATSVTINTQDWAYLVHTKDGEGLHVFRA